MPCNKNLALFAQCSSADIGRRSQPAYRLIVLLLQLATLLTRCNLVAPTQTGYKEKSFCQLMQ